MGLAQRWVSEIVKDLGSSAGMGRLARACAGVLAATTDTIDTIDQTAVLVPATQRELQEVDVS